MPNPDYMPYLQMMDMTKKYSPMMEMPQEELESMYPRSYYMINPEVEHQCDMAMQMYGPMFSPTRQHIEQMVDNIDNAVGKDVDAEYDDSDDETRQFGHFGFFGGRRRFRRDLITILLLREFLRRRRPHFGGYPMYPYMGYGGYPY